MKLKIFLLLLSIGLAGYANACGKNAQCNNGLDDDGDTLIDANDPDCETIYDDDESVYLAACRDGIDNDSDGFIDYPADTDCGYVNDDSEGVGAPAVVFTGPIPAQSIDQGSFSSLAFSSYFSNETSCALSPTAPTGMTFSSACVLSGTPTVTQFSTSYTITASNANSSDTGSFNLQILATATTECSDGIDNADPEDTLVDLADPGCTDAADNDETDPVASGTFEFIDRSSTIFSGTACTSNEPFDRAMFELEGEVYLLNADHNTSISKDHCVWKWDGTDFAYQDALSNQLRSSPSNGAFGWSVEAIDIDGDSQGQLELLGRTTGSEADDGYYKYDTVTNSFSWEGNNSQVWQDCNESPISHYFDANLNGVIDPADSNECITSPDLFFDSDNSGTPNAVTSPFPNGACDGSIQKNLAAYADFDNDGDTDIYCHHTEGSSVGGATGDNFYIASNQYIETGSDTFVVLTGPTPPFSATEPAWNKSTRSALDFDNNGYVDFISGVHESGTFVWMNMDGTAAGFTVQRFSSLDNVSGSPYAYGNSGNGVFDYDGDCDLDFVVQVRGGQGYTNNLYVGENQVGGNCLSVEARSYDKVTVRRISDNSIVFHYEYVTRQSLSQPFGVVHVGLGSLTPSDVTCTIDSIYSAPAACTIRGGAAPSSNVSFNGPIPDQTATQGVFGSYDFSSYFADETGCTINTMPAGMSFNTACVLSGTPTTLQGLVSYTITASNAIPSSDTGSFNLQVIAAATTECSDGINNDPGEDSLIDLADPGCTDSFDDSELDPVASGSLTFARVTLPACLPTHPSNPGGRQFNKWDGTNWHLITFDQANNAKANCAWKYEAGSWTFLQDLSDDFSFAAGNSSGISPAFGAGSPTMGSIDVDGDGRIDMHDRTNSEGIDGFFRNTGDDSAVWVGNRTGGSSPDAFDEGWFACADKNISHLIDVDNDGQYEGDLLTECQDNGYWADWNGNGTVTQIGTPSGFNCQRVMTVFGDVENDGDTDLMCLRYIGLDSEDTFTVAVNDGSGNFTVQDKITGLPATGGTTFSKAAPAAVDIDNNGCIDYVSNGTGQYDSSSPYLFLNDCSGGWTRVDFEDIDGLADSIYPHSNGVGIADYDNDCDVDLSYKVLVGDATALFENQLNPGAASCMSIKVDPYDRVRVWTGAASFAAASPSNRFSYEYVHRHRLSQIAEHVHVGFVGTCEIIRDGSSIACP